MEKANSDHVQKEGRFETPVSFCLRKFTVDSTCTACSQNPSGFSVNVLYDLPHPQMQRDSEKTSS